MYERVNRISDEVRKYDSLLFARRTPKGTLQVCRKVSRLEASDFGQAESPEDAELTPRLVIALTTDWTPYGQPVEWGLEPIMAKLRSMDAWTHNVYEDFCKNREARQTDQKNQRTRDIRDRATDMRSEFAKAVSDIA